jgi:hypothetical protein
MGGFLSTSTTPASESEPIRFDAFLSHRQKEAELLARAIYDRLTLQYGLNVFLDREILFEAEDLGKLEEYVKRSKCLIFILTSSILHSKWYHILSKYFLTK